MHPTILLASLLAVFLAGCNATPPQHSGDVSASGTNTDDLPAATDVPANDSAAPASDAETTPEALVISTNEPFWQARIDGGTLTLTGVDSAERRLSVESSVASANGREVIASDALGTVQAVVSDRACQDDMSGAHFPLTGALTIDGVGPIRGCARPASMPPPGEPGDDAVATTTIPEPWRGRWAPTADACRNPASSIEGIAITARELRVHESIGVPSQAEMTDADTLRLTTDYEGEGQQWTYTQVLRLSDDRNALEIEGPGDVRIQRIRCES